MTDIAWATGLFEGEGCITGSLGKHDIHLALQMCDEDIVRRFARVMEVGTVMNPKADFRGGRKPAWRWQVDGDKAEAALARLLPLLGSRRTARAIELLTRRHEWRAAAWAERECPSCGTRFRPETDARTASTIRYCSAICRLRASDRAYRRRSGACPRGEATHCRNGHEYTPENTGRGRDGSRRCMACGRAKSARYSARRRARAAL